MQWKTYDGLLEGLPTKEWNTQILRDTKNDAKKFCGINEVYLIEPKQTPIIYEGKYPFGEPASLPPVTCIAELWYYTTFKDDTKDFSSLGLIWFQDDYAFPVDIEILKQIEAIPFSKVCGEFNY